MQSATPDTSTAKWGALGASGGEVADGGGESDEDLRWRSLSGGEL